MPNHVYSFVSVFGTADDVRRFREAARGKYPPTGDPPGDHNHVDMEKRPVVEFCAHALVPLPPLFSQVTYGRGRENGPQGFDMERETWGIKWGTSDESPPVEDVGLVTYHVYTPWSPPQQILEKVAPKWPTLRFILSWGGEGPTRGRYVFKGGPGVGGTIPYRKEDYRDYPPDVTAEQEDEISKHNDEIEQSEMLSHWSFIGRQIGRFGDDVPAGIVADWLADNHYPAHELKLRERIEATDSGRKSR